MVKAKNTRDIIFPLMGLAFLWKYFRFQGFWGTVFPRDAAVGFLGSSISGFTVFLIVLAALSVAAALLPERIEELVVGHRRSMVVLCALGSLGAIIMMSGGDTTSSPLLFWVYMPLIAIGFLAGYLMWARYLSCAFCADDLVLLAGSYVLNLALFGIIGFDSLLSSLFTALTPFIVGLCWILSSPIARPTAAAAEGSLKDIAASAGLLVAFLVAGSIIRGIVDFESAGTGGTYLRLALSIAVAAIVLAACLRFRARCRKAEDGSSATTSSVESQGIERLTVISWIALALLFFVGIFTGMLSGTYGISGHIVVVSRSMLDFFLWVMLCNLISQRRISPYRPFLVFGMATSIVSWYLSYVTVPAILSASTLAGSDAMSVLVLTIVFGLLAFIIIVLGLLVLRRRPLDAPAQPQAATPAESPIAAPVTIDPDFVERYHLTKREAEVLGLFAQGHSLRRVASELYISQSTAQTHIKSAYRKLDIHSKDELIDLLANRRSS